MPRPKFRIWDKESKKWYKPTYRAYQNELEDLLLDETGDLVMRTMTRFDHESLFPNRFEVVMYTGINDRNGFEIHEGDIIKSETIPNRIGEAYVIRDIMEFHYNVLDLAIDPSDIEIIGNIFENGDLLPKEEEPT